MNDSTHDKTRVTAPWYIEHRVWTFLLAFLVWILFTWPFSVEYGMLSVRAGDLVAGAAAALLVAVVMRPVNMEPIRIHPTPVRCFWFIVYMAVLAWFVICANLDVAYRVLHPAMPLRPGIVKVRSNLRSPTALTMLANSITLTPGTLTVNVSDDGTLYVHWINIESTDIHVETQRVVGRFEWLLSRVFE